MNDIFKEYLRKFILVFFDDILVYSGTFKLHLQHVQVVFQVLQHHQLVINYKKCVFAQPKLEYLGHLISSAGVQADPSKVQCMLSWPIPRNLKDLRGFLGLTGYYRKFVQNYGAIAAPLTDLLKKDAFHWSNVAQCAFDTLKAAMSTTPVLALPNFTQQFLVEADASGFGVGAVLMQHGRPIAYHSQVLSKKYRDRSIYERELMAIVFAIKKWHHYLMGRHFIIRTDQKALKFLLEQRVMDESQQHWVAKLMGYSFEIHYKPGKHNNAADALSRREQPVELNSFSLWQLGSWANWEQEIHSDPTLAELIQKLGAGQQSDSGFYLKHGVLFHKGRLVIPKNSPRIPLLLKEFHNSPFGGHSGHLRTYKRISNFFYWDGMKRDVQNHVNHCDVCQRHKYQALSPAGLLQPLPIPQQVWEDISMDFITGLPKSQRFDTILVVVDRLTKYAHFLPLSHPFTTKEVAALFTKEIIRLHGFPKTIVSDRDRIFISLFWKELFKLSGTSLCYSSGYHPQTDGQTA